jgi:hypothetical protein
VEPLGEVAGGNGYMQAVKMDGLPSGRLALSIGEGDAAAVHTVSAALAAQMRLFYAALGAARSEGAHPATGAGEDAAQDLGKGPDAITNEIANRTLQINLCPFQSPKWESLADSATAREFCVSLWADILAHIRPSVMLALGVPAYRKWGTECVC